MKIRIRGNSVRIRISMPELETFRDTGYLEEVTDFGSSQFVYALQNKENMDDLSADFSDGKITVYMPEKLRNEWVSTDAVGYSHDMETGSGHSLFLLVEKDWACIDNTLEDQSENFPNPNTAC